MPDDVREFELDVEAMLRHAEAWSATPEDRETMRRLDRQARERRYPAQGRHIEGEE